jgi:hypothetical protein
MTCRRSSTIANAFRTERVRELRGDTPPPAWPTDLRAARLRVAWSIKSTTIAARAAATATADARGRGPPSASIEQRVFGR